MRFDFVTLFGELIETYCSHSITARAQKNEVIKINTINPRDFSKDKHKKVDDTPYGGGAGMVLMCQPFFDAVESIKREEKSKIIMLTPQGKPFNNEMAIEYSKLNQLILVCGHYEGFDERIRTGIEGMEEISIGDFVLTGGELGALCIMDATLRYVEGSLGKIESAHEDSFGDGLLEHPQYTRPYDFRGMKVPEILLSGNHQKIAEWRKEQALERTKIKRPDLHKKYLEE